MDKLNKRLSRNKHLKRWRKKKDALAYVPGTASSRFSRPESSGEISDKWSFSKSKFMLVQCRCQLKGCYLFVIAFWQFEIHANINPMPNGDKIHCEFLQNPLQISQRISEQVNTPYLTAIPSFFQIFTKGFLKCHFIWRLYTRVE